MRHIHIGAGNFSLGFVAWLTAQVGFSPLILARSPQRGARGAERRIRYSALKRTRRYKVQYLDLGQEDEVGAHVAIESFLFYDQRRDRKKLVNYIESLDEDVLITSSVKERSAINDVSEIICDIRHALIKDRRAYVIACENGFTTSDVKLNYGRGGRSLEGIFFIDAVVDRICSQIFVEGPDVIVEAESHASLVIQRVDGCEDLATALQSRWVNYSDHLDVYRHVKLCVLNAAHIFLAGDAQTFGASVLPDYLSIEEVGLFGAPTVRERRHHIRAILGELAEGLRSYCIDEYGGDQAKLHLLERLTDAKSLDAILERFTRVDDEVERVLSRLKSPTVDHLHTMSDFLRSMIDKVRPPVIGYLIKNKHGPLHITRSFMRIVDLIAERRFPERATRH